MNVLAYCDERYLEVTRRVVGRGAVVVASPPAGDPDWRTPAGRAMLTESDMILFNFHAMPGVDAWLNTRGDVALMADSLAALDLSRSVVFLVNCYGGGGMLPALKATGARLIVGGEGENFGGVSRLGGADLLAQRFVSYMRLGAPPRLALMAAKAALRLGAQTRSVKDALAFKVL